MPVQVNNYTHEYKNPVMVSVNLIYKATTAVAITPAFRME